MITDYLCKIVPFSINIKIRDLIHIINNRLTKRELLKERFQVIYYKYKAKNILNEKQKIIDDKINYKFVSNDKSNFKIYELKQDNFMTDR